MRRSCNSYLHNDSFPASHRLWCGPLGYHGSKAAMKLIHEADVVLALGSRLGPFGTLPQYGFDYWPKNAKLIQVDADPAGARPGEEDRGHGLRRRARGGAGARRAAAGATARRRSEPRRAHQRGSARRGGLGAGARRAGISEKDAWSLEVARGSQLHAPAADAARAREGDARGRDGVDRHRQHLPDRQQLSALRAAAQHVRRDDVRQLRLRLPHHDRLQGRRRRIARRSPTSATAPGA